MGFFVLSCRLKDVIHLRNRRTPRNMHSRSKGAAKQRRKGGALKVILSLILFFPLGITLMWRRKCGWPSAVKFAVTGVMMAAVITIFALPAPASRHTGGVRLVGANPEVEVYGPELPVAIVSGYTQPSIDSIIVNTTNEEVHYVYAADGAECYHEYECKFAYASSQRLTVYEAHYLGFRPCGLCNPPAYEPDT